MPLGFREDRLIRQADRDLKRAVVAGSRDVVFARQEREQRARRRLDRASPLPELPSPADKPPPPSRPAWKINIERADGQRIQISARTLPDGRLLHGSTIETPKQLGRRLGILLHHGAL